MKLVKLPILDVDFQESVILVKPSAVSMVFEYDGKTRLDVGRTHVVSPLSVAEVLELLAGGDEKCRC